MNVTTCLSKHNKQRACIIAVVLTNVMGVEGRMGPARQEARHGDTLFVYYHEHVPPHVALSHHTTGIAKLRGIFIFANNDPIRMRCQSAGRTRRLARDASETCDWGATIRGRSACTRPRPSSSAHSRNGCAIRALVRAERLRRVGKGRSHS